MITKRNIVVRNYKDDDYMKVDSLNNMVKGWFVGDFSPTLIKTRDVEVAVKKYKAGNYEGCHHHEIATELTVVVEGSVRMNGVVYKENDIIVMESGESTDFMALTDCKCVVVKYPGAVDDKYIG
jgi:hypothetical protein